jgi:hypothetical protein
MKLISSLWSLLRLFCTYLKPCKWPQFFPRIGVATPCLWVASNCYNCHTCNCSTKCFRNLGVKHITDYQLPPRELLSVNGALTSLFSSSHIVINHRTLFSKEPQTEFQPETRSPWGRSTLKSHAPVLIPFSSMHPTHCHYCVLLHSGCHITGVVHILWWPWLWLPEVDQKQLWHDQMVVLPSKLHR